MSVTPDVSQVEMWPYVASAVAASESHAATAVLIVVSSATMGVAEGAAEGAAVGAGVAVGSDVGANVGGCVGAGVQYVGALVVGMELGAARATSQISR